MRRSGTGRDRTGAYDEVYDLHGFAADEAIDFLSRVLKRHAGAVILVVHGDGSGVLRTRIRAALRSGRLPCRDFFPGEDVGAPGSYGVTVVRI